VVPVLMRGEGAWEVSWPPLLLSKNPEPDFSMPFKVIAMVMGLIVYNWINLWRIIFKIKDKNE
jgi:hypothetical protein